MDMQKKYGGIGKNALWIIVAKLVLSYERCWKKKRKMFGCQIWWEARSHIKRLKFYRTLSQNWSSKPLWSMILSSCSFTGISPSLSPKVCHTNSFYFIKTIFLIDKSCSCTLLFTVSAKLATTKLFASHYCNFFSQQHCLLCIRDNLHWRK